MQFNHPLFNQEAINKLSPVEKERLKKVLDKLWCFDGLICSMGAHLKAEFEFEVLKSKHTTNNMWKWSRAKFNNMNDAEQREYEAGLIKGRTYHINYEGNSCREVAKVIYNVLNLPDITKHEALDK